MIYLYKKLNLITNSIKFTHAGQVEFGLLEVQDQVTFYVKDSGIGIAENVGDNIFNRFHKIV